MESILSRSGIYRKSISPTFTGTDNILPIVRYSLLHTSRQAHISRGFPTLYTVVLRHLHCALCKMDKYARLWINNLFYNVCPIVCKQDVFFKKIAFIIVAYNIYISLYFLYNIGIFCQLPKAAQQRRHTAAKCRTATPRHCGQGRQKRCFTNSLTQ